LVELLEARAQPDELDVMRVDLALLDLVRRRRQQQ
jgi:hypothetical protein